MDGILSSWFFPLCTNSDSVASKGSEFEAGSAEGDLPTWLLVSAMGLWEGAGHGGKDVLSSRI